MADTLNKYAHNNSIVIQWIVIILDNTYTLKLTSLYAIELFLYIKLCSPNVTITEKARNWDSAQLTVAVNLLGRPLYLLDV